MLKETRTSIEPEREKMLMSFVESSSKNSLIKVKDLEKFMDLYSYDDCKTIEENDLNNKLRSKELKEILPMFKIIDIKLWDELLVLKTYPQSTTRDKLIKLIENKRTNNMKNNDRINRIIGH